MIQKLIEAWTIYIRGVNNNVSLIVCDMMTCPDLCSFDLLESMVNLTSTCFCTFVLNFAYSVILKMWFWDGFILFCWRCLLMFHGGTLLSTKWSIHSLLKGPKASLCLRVLRRLLKLSLSKFCLNLIYKHKFFKGKWYNMCC